MPRLVIVRPVHYLPGKREEVVRWAQQTEAIRRQWGMETMFQLRSTIDHEEYLLIQVWQSKEAYARWKASPERAALFAESNKMVLHDPSRSYEEML